MNKKGSFYPIEIYTDGSCVLNEQGSPGGWGFIIIDNKNIIKMDKGYQLFTTNQQMEITACIKSLEGLLEFKYKPNTKVIIHTDSAYVCNCFNQFWYEKWLKNGWINSQKKPVANKELWEDLLSLNNYFDVKYSKVKGHSGDANNELADKLARIGTEEAKKIIRSKINND